MLGVSLSGLPIQPGIEPFMSSAVMKRRFIGRPPFPVGVVSASKLFQGGAPARRIKPLADFIKSRLCILSGNFPFEERFRHGRFPFSDFDLRLVVDEIFLVHGLCFSRQGKVHSDFWYAVGIFGCCFDGGFISYRTHGGCYLPP